MNRAVAANNEPDISCGSDKTLVGGREYVLLKESSQQAPFIIKAPVNDVVMPSSAFSHKPETVGKGVRTGGSWQ